MNPLEWLSFGWVRGLLVAVALAAAAAGVAWFIGYEREIGRDEVRAEWSEAKAKQAEADRRATEQKLEESKRRVIRQSENQDAQNIALAQARADADGARAVADRLRRESASAAEQWRARLADSPTRADIEAAGASIVLLTDLLGKSRERSRVLAEFADTSRAHGLKCQRDYEALTPPKEPK